MCECVCARVCHGMEVHPTQQPPALHDMALSVFSPLLLLLQVPNRRVVRHEKVGGVLRDVFDASMQEAAPLVANLVKACKEPEEVGAAGEQVRSDQIIRQISE